MFTVKVIINMNVQGTIIKKQNLFFLQTAECNGINIWPNLSTHVLICTANSSFLSN